jgi:esterase/lipase
MRMLRIIAVIILFLICIYFFGPRPQHPTLSNDLPPVPAQTEELESYVQQHEAMHKLKRDNDARIIWYNDSSKEKTEYAVVYLHGFSASREEGDPVHTNFARKFGCNLFLSRLAEHGIDTTDPMVNLTADELWNSAKEAYSIGKQLGKKIILMSTSTGGTLALKLASEFPDIAGLILLSPNIAINDGAAWMLNNPWGLQMALIVKGKFNTSTDTTAIYKKYWYDKYKMKSVVQLEELLEMTMKETTFKKIEQPVLMLYYYKDEKHQDRVVKVSAMKRMFSELGTPYNKKRSIAIPNAGDHVIGSYIKSKDLKTVEAEIEKFAIEVLNLKKVE